VRTRGRYGYATQVPFLMGIANRTGVSGTPLRFFAVATTTMVSMPVTSDAIIERLVLPAAVVSTLVVRSLRCPSGKKT
jgi:hypothetical protein